MLAQKQILIPSIGAVTLTGADHLASGGEGAVYVKRGYAIKLYHNPVEAEKNGAADKIRLLSDIHHPFIVAPIGPVLDSKQAFVGYYMPLADGVPLVKTFTNAWRDLLGFDIKKTIKLVANMREAVSAAHSFGAIMADGNEMNYLAQDVLPKIIDVDSWQIGKFKASAQMLSIRDYHTPALSQASDWFAWGVVTFQVFTGIHPYKGTHPDFRRGDLETRMRSQASVFDQKVKLNSAVRGISDIPLSLRNWYEDVFQRGERSAPPANICAMTTASTPMKHRIVRGAAHQVTHTLIESFAGSIRHVSANGVVFYSDNGLLKGFDLRRNSLIGSVTTAQIDKVLKNRAALIRFGDGFVYLEIGVNAIAGTVIPSQRQATPMHTRIPELACLADRFIVFDDRVFAINPDSERGMLELSIETLGGRAVLSVKSVWPVAARSTRFYDGFGIMDALGMPFVIIPHDNTVQILRAAELVGYQVTGGFARSPNSVLISAVVRHSGKVVQLMLRQSGNMLQIAHERESELTEISVAMNNRGVIAMIEEDGELVVSQHSWAASKVVSDTSLSRMMSLFSMHDSIYYWLDAQVFRLNLA